MIAMLLQPSAFANCSSRAIRCFHFERWRPPQATIVQNFLLFEMESDVTAAAWIVDPSQANQSSKRPATTSSATVSKSVNVFSSAGLMRAQTTGQISTARAGSTQTTSTVESIGEGSVGGCA